MRSRGRLGAFGLRDGGRDLSEGLLCELSGLGSKLLYLQMYLSCAYNAHVSSTYNINAPKRPVNMTLNEDLVRCAREYASNLSEQVEKLLAEFVAAEKKRRTEEDGRLDAAITAWNDFDEEHGAFADEHADL